MRYAFPSPTPWLVSPGIHWSGMAALGTLWLPHARAYHWPLLRDPGHWLESSRRVYWPVFSGAPYLCRAWGLHLGFARAVRRCAAARRHCCRRHSRRRHWLRSRHALPAHPGYLSGPGHLGLCRVDPPPHHCRVPDHARRPRAAHLSLVSHATSNTLLLSLPGAGAGGDLGRVGTRPL